MIHLANNHYWDTTKSALLIYDTPIDLSTSQRKLMEFLIANLGRPVESVDIFNAVWDDADKKFTDKSVRNLIYKLRSIAEGLIIQNIYGGYYMLQRQKDFEQGGFNENLIDVLEQIQNPIIVTDPNKDDNPIVFTNSAFSSLFGYGPDELIGKNCRILHRDDSDQAALMHMHNAMENKEEIIANVRHYKKNGQLLHDEVAISPIFDTHSGSLKYFLGIHRVQRPA